MDQFLRLTPELHEYVVAHATPRDDVLRDVERETDGLGGIAIMQTGIEQAAFLELLVKLMGARRAIELGTFTGYGAIRIARGLSDGGTLLCCELEQKWADLARRNVDAAGVGERVEIALGPALETVRGLPSEPTFDFAYLDADKEGYPDYYEELVPRLAQNGVLVIDNVLAAGMILEPERDERVEAIARLNDRIPGDDRVESVMLAVGDGITLVRKR